MLIDKTHSKKDIVSLFRKLGVVIDDELTKGNIVNDIDKYIEGVDYNEKIKNCTELKEYLKKSNTSIGDFIIQSYIQTKQIKP